MLQRFRPHQRRCALQFGVDFLRRAADQEGRMGFVAQSFAELCVIAAFVFTTENDPEVPPEGIDGFRGRAPRWLLWSR